LETLVYRGNTTLEEFFFYVAKHDVKALASGNLGNSVSHCARAYNTKRFSQNSYSSYYDLQGSQLKFPFN